MKWRDDAPLPEVRWALHGACRCEVAQTYRPESDCRVRGKLYAAVLAQAELLPESRTVAIVCGVHLFMLKRRGMVARVVPLAGVRWPEGS